VIKFADEATISVSSGKGGTAASRSVGKSSFPSGAGGRGWRARGRCDLRSPQELAYPRPACYQQSFKAENGQPGMGKNMHGRDGATSSCSCRPEPLFGTRYGPR